MSDYIAAGVIVDLIEKVAKANAEPDAVTAVLIHVLDQARLLQSGMLLKVEEDEEIRTLLDGLEDMRLEFEEGENGRRLLGKAIDLIEAKLP